MRRRLPILLASVVAAGLLLAACAPTATRSSEPLVAVLNGPAEGRIGGSAETLQSAMRRQGPLRFTFAPAAAMRFAEGHNDFFHYRAELSAGRVARSYGARYAVLIGATPLEREVVVSKDGSYRTVTVTLRMEAVVVDAATDRAIARLDSQLMQQTRTESTAEALPPLQRDPSVLALRDEGVADVAPAVVGALWHALDIHPGPSAG